MSMVVVWLIAIFFVGCLAIIWWTLFVDHDLTEEPNEEEISDPLTSINGPARKKKKTTKGGGGRRAMPKKPSAMPKAHDPSWDGPASPLLLTEVKGHTAQVTAVAFSRDNRFVASASEDRTVRVSFLATLKTPSPRYFLLNIDRDHVTALAFSDNNKRLVCATAKTREIVFYSIPTEKEATAGIKPELLKRFQSGHEETITKLLLLDVDKWMVIATSACGSTETGIRFMNPRGECLATLDTNQMSNHTMVASADNRFVAVGAGRPEVKVLEVTRKKDGEFKQVTRAMTLSGGHGKAVHGVAFNHDSTRIVTASVDGSWVLWDMTVRYTLDEDPRQLERYVSKDLLNSKYSCLALGGGRGSRTVVALASGRHMFFHVVGEGTCKQIESVGAAHGSSGAAILSMQASQDGKLLATTAEGDSRARLWTFPGTS